jgi:hypothetical protein
MKLLVHELKTTLKQQFQPTENLDVLYVRPHLYKHNSPSGSLKIQILGESEELIKESSLITISSISSANYFHGYIRFEITVPLRSSNTYYMALASSGYSFAEGAYIGWCNDYDLRKVSATYTPSVGYSAALDFELWTKNTLTRGA